MKAIKSNLIHYLGNNLITIGRLKTPLNSLETHENWFVAEVMNEITHLPYDSFLLPFLRKLDVPVRSTDANDIMMVECWGMGYLDPDTKKGHHVRLSVQADTTIISKEVVVLFEFKKPHRQPSQNTFETNQIGRQVLLAAKLALEYKVPAWKSIIVCNTAPKVRVKGLGVVHPAEAAKRYYENGDAWLHSPVVKKFLPVNPRKDNYFVLTWIEFMNKAKETLEDARRGCSCKGCKRLYDNAAASLHEFLKRRKELLRG